MWTQIYNGEDWSGKFLENPYQARLFSIVYCCRGQHVNLLNSPHKTRAFVYPLLPWRLVRVLLGLSSPNDSIYLYLLLWRLHINILESFHQTIFYNVLPQMLMSYIPFMDQILNINTDLIMKFEKYFFLKWYKYIYIYLNKKNRQ